MEIHDNSFKRSLLGEVNKRLGAKKIIRIFLIIFIAGSFGLFCIIYGGYLNKTRQNIKIGKLIISLVEFDFSFIPNKINSVSTEIEKFHIDIKFINFEKLRYRRNLALKRNKIIDEDQAKVPAIIKFKGDEYKVDVSLTGYTNMHICNPNKWSLSVKVKQGKTIMGMKKFALLVPRARGYLTDWTATTLLKSKGVIGIRSDFVDVTINGDNLGIYYLEERYDKILIENNNKREGIIFKIVGEELSIYGMSKVLETKELHSQYIQLRKLWYSFLNNKIEPNEIFDLDKLATLAVITDIMCEKHAMQFSNLRFYFNPITGLCEPIAREWGYLQEPFKNQFISLFPNQTSLLIEKPNNEHQAHKSLMNRPVFKKICNLTFKELYIKEADILSEQSYLDSVLFSGSSLKEILNKVHKENPFYKFPLKVLHENQNYIREKIYPQGPIIDAYIDSFSKDSIILFVENKTDLPVEIHYLSYNSVKRIILPNRIIINANFESTESKQVIAFPMSKDIGFASFSSDSLEIHYSILGLNNIKKTIVFQKKMTTKDYASLNYARQPSNINEFIFLRLNDKKKTIEFPAGKCNISRDLIIPEGYIVSAKPGCQINLTNLSRIISYSPILFFGKSDSLISITSSDSTGQGIVVFNCNQNSELSHVNFSNLSNISDFGWDLRGAITFYESPVNINNCNFSDNIRGDDYLNIIRTDFNILNTTFENTKADAFDSDFCTGTIENVKFNLIGNDAIDVSGTKLYINKVDIINPGDKGISGGEASSLICENIKINGGEIAIASKDNTIINIIGISINSCKLAYCAFQKKAEYGPGKIIVKNATLKNVDVDYLIEVGSSLSINGIEINQKRNKVKEMLYGAEYGRSSK
jgi:hypothetical protein